MTQSNLCHCICKDGSIRCSLRPLRLLPNKPNIAGYWSMGIYLV